MRGLIRLPEPQILIERGSTWTNDFINSTKPRPDSSKYGHDKIRIQLISMSFCKCFYCESKLNDKPKEVDHHIEVSVNRGLSFTWNNLYLSCDNCNDKLKHDNVPIHEALDPCRNDDSEIQEHLTFVDELITAVDGSTLGFKTIQKYRLDSELLDKRRITQLKNFHKVLIQILKKQSAEGRKELNETDMKTLNFFKQVDQPYSLMFKVILDKFSKL